MTQITLRDIDDRLERLEDRIVRRIDDHEERIRINEGFRFRVLGMAGTVSAIFGLLGSYIMDMIKR